MADIYTCSVDFAVERGGALEVGAVVSQEMVCRFAHLKHRRDSGNSVHFRIFKEGEADFGGERQ